MWMSPSLLATHIVNPAVQEVPDSPIAGMPVLEPWLEKLLLY